MDSPPIDRLLRYLALPLLLAVAGGETLALATPGGSSLLLSQQVEGQQALTARVEGGEDWIPRNAALTIELSRSLEPRDGRLVVLIGNSDVSELFAPNGQSLVYRPELLPLPAGENELVVLLQKSDGTFVEILRTQVKVLQRGGLESSEVGFSLDLQGNAQLDEGHSPDDNAPPRSTFEEATGQINFRAGANRSGWQLSTNVNLQGVTQQEQALRFAEKGEDADRLDLASYLLRLEKGRGFVELGHVNFGEQRHLISSFGSRGLRFSLPLGKQLSFTALAGAGSAVVGFDNISGLSESQHRMLAGTLALDAVPGKPGALRLEATWSDAERLPIANFNQGVVNDTETNQGFALRIHGQPSSRVRFDLGAARSEFTNPADPLLAQGDDLVAVQEEERDAYFGQLSFVLLQRTTEKRGWQQSLNLDLSYEHVEPLYKSIGAFAQADIEQTGANLGGSFGPIAITAGHNRSEDNLDDVESILKTKTRRSNFMLGLPLRQLRKSQEGGGWLPTLSYTLDRTHQFGASLPVNGGFNESHVPDQVSLNHVGGLEWQGNRWRFGYQLSVGDQDNRQPGRELNDFEQLNHRWSLNLSPMQKLDLGLEFSRERGTSVAEDRTETTERPALNLLWRPTSRLSLTGNYSLTEGESPTSKSDSEVLSLEASYRLDWRGDRQHGVGGQLFVRFSEQSLESIDRLFNFNIDQNQWTINAGLNLSIR